MYRLLLLLLPPSRRAMYGAEMTEVFTALLARARREGGWIGVLTATAKETFGIIRFALRERFGRGARMPGPSLLGPELLWAWRGIRARRWTAAFTVGLLALAVAANGIVFSVADAVVFNTVPYPGADRIITFVDAARPSGPASLSKSAFKELTRQADVLKYLAAYNGTAIFLTGEGAAERVTALNVTPQLMDVLGVRPEWGRSLSASDILPTDSDAVLVSAALATSRFGHPEAAVGRTLETTDLPLRIIGVMPADFRFPGGREQIWRGFDLEGPLAKNVFATTALGRLRDGLSFEATVARLAVTSGGPLPRPYEGQRHDPASYWALLGAAACLLLTACANAASVELAMAVGRSRTYAIQRSLGASKWVLARVALIEGALIVGVASLVGTGVASMALHVLTSALPDVYSTVPVNPIDLDYRVIAFMVVVSAFVWVVTTIPVIVFASGARVIEVLKGASHSHAGSAKGTWTRHALTVTQIALATVLLVGSLLFTHTYLARINIDKGFDSTNLAEVSLTIPPQLFDQRVSVMTDLLERLKSLPGVEAVMPTVPPQSANVPSAIDSLEIDGVAFGTPKLFLSTKTVPWNYHDVLRIPLRSGRPFIVGEPPTQVIVSEHFAKKFWPDGAIGHTFRESPADPALQIIGVAAHVRTIDDGRKGLEGDRFLYYVPQQPPRPRASQSVIARRTETRGSSVTGYLVLTVRVDSPDRLTDVLDAARSSAPKFQASVTLVDQEYAKWEADTLLQTQVITSFGILAFLMAIAGVYGVMAFLVASRTRELGVRMALGASHGDVVSLVLGSATRLALVGAGLGLTGAFVGTRYVESQLSGVSPTDPLTYVTVSIVVIAGATVATWWPARQAARVDPAITLRAE
jgi:putative ABC transport system permease protein